MRYRVRMVVVDYLQIMKLEERPSERLDTAIGRYTSGLKEVAGEFGVHVLDVSQLTREVLKDARRPQTSDLKESGSIENDSDIVSFIHRPFIAEDDKKSERAVATRDYAELIIGKLRGRGKSKGIGTTVLRFFEAQTRFAEPDDATRARWRSARGDDEPPPDGRRRRK
jgi:replicative DNA helicase